MLHVKEEGDLPWLLHCTWQTAGDNDILLPDSEEQRVFPFFTGQDKLEVSTSPLEILGKPLTSWERVKNWRKAQSSGDMSQRPRYVPVPRGWAAWDTGTSVPTGQEAALAAPHPGGTGPASLSHACAPRRKALPVPVLPAQRGQAEPRHLVSSRASPADAVPLLCLMPSGPVPPWELCPATSVASDPAWDLGFGSVRAWHQQTPPAARLQCLVLPKGAQSSLPPVTSL